MHDDDEPPLTNEELLAMLKPEKREIVDNLLRRGHSVETVWDVMHTWFRQGRDEGGITLTEHLVLEYLVRIRRGEIKVGTPTPDQ